LFFHNTTFASKEPPVKGPVAQIHFSNTIKCKNALKLFHQIFFRVINMLGKPNQLQPTLFYNSFSLEQRVHEDHPLRKIKNLIDFSFIRSEVEGLYGYNGN